MWKAASTAPLGYALLNQAADAIQLCRSDNGADVDRLIKRRAHAQCFHAAAHLGRERLRNAFLHQ